MASSVILGLIGPVAVCFFFVAGCAQNGRAGTSAAAEIPRVGLVPGPSPTVASEATLTFAGGRCTKQSCKCRKPGHDDQEQVPPPEGSKRFEIRMSATGGLASVNLTDLGTLVAASHASDSDRAAPREVPSPSTVPARDETQPDTDDETCAYIDVPAGSAHDVVFVSRESIRGQGVAPRLRIAEYGPKAQVWYDLIAVTCDGRDGRCDRHAADAWSLAARQRKRGRLDPCGSAVVTKLGWETSGGQAERDGGLFRDFTVRFTMEIKKFSTQFVPGSTECVPK